MEVLVVDDQKMQRYALVHFLKQFEDFKISEAESGSEALELFRLHRFEVVICDFRMPGLNGYDVYEAVKDLVDAPKFYLWTDEDENSVPDFDGSSFGGIVRKLDMQKLVDLLRAHG